MAETLEPAGDDDFIADFLDVNWREATRAARELQDVLRALVPEMSAQIPETAYNALQRALNDAQSAYGELHRAGRYVIGSIAYDQYLSAQVQRRIDG